MQEPRTWRELLSQNITSPRERQRIAGELNVRPITLARWVSGNSTPRQDNIQRLLEVFPEQREQLQALLQQEFGDFHSLMGESEMVDESTIPVAFYIRVLRTLATLPRSVRFSSLCDMILQQALKQLDPQRVGMAVTVAVCMPPRPGGKVRTLRETVGRGTRPWENMLEQQGVLLGAESLAGYAITTGHVAVNQNLRDRSTLAAGYRGKFEESALAAPIMITSDVAGSLLFSSKLTDYFTAERRELAQSYAELLALAFDQANFYDVSEIELRAVPPEVEQPPYLNTFRQRLMRIMVEGQKNYLPITLAQAELLAWQEIEDELLQYYLSPHSR